MARPRPKDSTRVIREMRRLEDRYNVHPSSLDFETVTFYHPDTLTESLTFTAVVDRHGQVHWYDEDGASLPKSIGWTLRAFARRE